MKTINNFVPFSDLLPDVQVDGGGVTLVGADGAGRSAWTPEMLRHAYESLGWPVDHEGSFEPHQKVYTSSPEGGWVVQTAPTQGGGFEANPAHEAEAPAEESKKAK